MKIKKGQDSWIINKHINNYNLLVDYLIFLNNNSKISNDSINEKISQLIEKGIYKPRFGSIKRSTFFNKVAELSFYTMGFRSNTKKFLLSPLSDLFLKYFGDTISLKKDLFDYALGDSVSSR